MPYITLKHDALCSDCGAALPAGSKARWFRDGSVYGDACHRWSITVGKRRQLALQRTLQGVLHAARDRQIPDAATTRMAGLKEACQKRLTAATYRWLMSELAAIKEAIERCQN